MGAANFSWGSNGYPPIRMAIHWGETDNYTTWHTRSNVAFKPTVNEMPSVLKSESTCTLTTSACIVLSICTFTKRVCTKAACTST